MAPRNLEKRRRELVRTAFLPTYLALVLFLYYQAFINEPGLRYDGVLNIFLFGGLIALSLSVLYAAISDRFRDLIPKTTLDIFGLEDIKTIAAFGLGGLIFGSISAAQSTASYASYALVEAYSPATNPSLGLYSYILNGPIEDALVIMLPFWLIIVAAAVFGFKTGPVDSIKARMVVGVVAATILHVYAKGGIHLPTALLFAVFTYVAYRFGYVSADFFHAGWNAGNVTAAASVVAGPASIASSSLAPIAFFTAPMLTYALVATWKKRRGGKK